MSEEKELAKTQSEGVVQEKSLLESLFDKVDVSVPEKSGTIDSEQTGDRLSLAMNYFLRAITGSGQKIEKLDKVVVDDVIAQIDKKISDQVNSIMHQTEFQKLESAWRGLKFLIDQTDFNANVKIEILNVSKEELREDFEDSPEPVQSGLYRQIYIDEYDTPGGEPIGAIIGNYEFDCSPQDVTLLRNVSKIAAGTHAPFIASAGKEFLGVKSVDDIPLIPNLAEIFEKSEYRAWNGFRESEDSRYIGLTLPRFLLRLPYGKDTIPVKEFNFEEDASGSHEKYLWGNASFAMASNLMRSFSAHGWCLNIRGPQAGGLVENLPIHVINDDIKIPTEVLISDRKEFEFAELGFIPMSFYKNKDFACFFSAHSAQKPKKYKDAIATANSKLCANMPYLFLVSRLAHYLKVIQRENIGSAKEKDDLQKELQDWISGLVTTMKNPGQDLKARCPLSAASIKVTDFDDNPGFYQVEMQVKPHFQVEGVNVDLSLVSQLPKAK
ncbi:MAG: type VI secretion system contractile sheath large subunit [Candidatus Desantisbacteria bacterium]